MAGEWQKTTLDKLGPIITGKTPSTHNPKNFEGPIPFITPSDMDGRRCISTTARYVSEKGASTVSGALIPRGAVLVSCIGSDMGKAAIAGEQSVTNQQINSIVVQKPNSNLFVYYNLSNRKEEIRRSAGGSAQPILNKTAFGRLPILLPDPEQQQAIACTLGALDDKIELNRRMKQTLEAMAQAIFKSWFVDFEPVRAKAKGEQPRGLAPHIAELFSDSFEDSELGEIPKGWDVMPLFDVATYVNGAAFKSLDFCNREDGLPVIKIAELKNGITDQTKYSKRELTATQRVDTGDVLYSWSGSPDTSLDVFLWTRGPGLLNQHIFKVLTNSGAQKCFIYYLLKHLRPTLIEIARNKQTTGLGHVTIADMKRLDVSSPPGPVLHAFDQIVGPLFNRRFSGEKESDIISNLRDALLPKLISGGLPVPNAERIVKRCV